MIVPGYRDRGSVCFRMSRNNGKVDLKLNLSLSATRGNTSRRVAEDEDGSPNNSSSPSSCVSSEAANSPEATSMVLAGCPRCLMYVMLAQEEPKCPKCKSTVPLNFLNTAAPTTTDNSNKGKKNRKS